jgi:hypothetical protein
MISGNVEVGKHHSVATAPFDSAQGPEPVEGLCRRDGFRLLTPDSWRLNPSDRDDSDSD